ncbi:hypothetical protein [Afipia sp. GAS231]|uniref:hypothetical protein n=1 Tax=Afipia sp. GAS231 TaxID=1882747 RepID=UPI00087CCADD|nr:hypothetical protein [Afipia sp. GAS231]SDN25856.1 hypothetical protein SAMN05444050_1116 [Afipia sp. GAS231]
MTGFYFFLVSLCVVPYAFAAMMPTWRWLLGVTLTIGGVISAIWIQDWIAMSNPDYHEGAGGALGRLFFGLVTLGFLAGVVVRTITLILRSRGLPIRYGATICILGSAIVPGSLEGIDAWQKWKLRSPSRACLNATFNVKVANASFVIPAAGFFNVYLGKTSGADAYYFGMSPTLRAFCALSDHGKPTKATLIWLRFGQSQFIESLPSICTAPVANWATTYCAAYGAGRRDDSVEFPTDIHVFAPDEFRLGDFGGSRSTYADSLEPKTWPGAPAYVQCDTLTTDQHPLTFECSGTGNERWCKTSYPWKDGANLNYTFRVGYDDAAEKGKRIDAETRKFIAGFQAKP